MKNDQRLIEALKPIILAQMAKYPNELQEGFFDKVMNHISGILQKTNDKRFNRDLASLANSSPEGQKAVANFEKFSDELESTAALIAQMRKSGEL
jgi:hypothetical protein